MKYNPIANVVVSADERGSIEYWTPDISQISSMSSEGIYFFLKYLNVDGSSVISKKKGYVEPAEYCISWKLKGDTDLYEFKKVIGIPLWYNYYVDYRKKVYLPASLLVPITPSLLYIPLVIGKFVFLTLLLVNWLKNMMKALMQPPKCKVRFI